MHESHQEEHSKEWGHQKQNYNQTAWQIFMDRGLELWNHKEITTTLTMPGTVRAAVGRDIWIKKILGKISEKKLVNKGGCFKD